MNESAWKSLLQVQFDFIHKAFHHSYSLRGLNRLYLYYTPLTLAPQRARENSLNYQGRYLKRNVDWGSLIPGMVRSATGAIIQMQREAKHS